jgi:hypothetical protein
MTCHHCHCDTYRYTFKVSTGRLALCADCFTALPQKATWQSTIRSAFKGV